MFKKFIVLILLFSSQLVLKGQAQEIINGEISFVSSRNVYVKFSSTENISIGDTLSFENDSESIKGLIVTSKSSTSVVTTPLVQPIIPFKKGQKIYFQKINPVEIPIILDTILEKLQDLSEVDQEKPLPMDEEKIGQIKGSFAVGSYSNFNDYRNSHRFRYALILNGTNFAKNKLSFENYITYRYSSQNLEEIKDNIFSGLRVINMGIQYSLAPQINLFLGRKINRKFSNMGAVDGIQFEKEWKKFFAGSILGSRPDNITYGLNLNLIQFGFFGGFRNDKILSTVAFVEQKNKMNTDRRFLFMQHSGSLAGKIFLFSSFEIDLYKKINEEITNKPELTNFFFSANTNFNKTIRLSASFDKRRNVIYYESYKNYIDQLIDEETRQGLRASINVGVLKKLNLIGSVNWRFQTSGLNDSKNGNLLVNWSAPWGKGSSLSFTNSYLRTNYLDSKVFGLRIRQTFGNGKLDGDAYIRRVNYKYLNKELVTSQSFIGLNISYNLTQKMGLYIYGEVVVNDNNKNIEKRLNTRIIKRF